MAHGSRLNLGCGTDIRPGYINLDVAALPGVDVVHDLGSGPLPFEDASLTEVVAKDVLEHVDLTAVLREIHRVLAPGGTVSIMSPHFTSPAVWIDPTHQRGFSIDTLRFYVREDHALVRSYYFDFQFSAVADARIVFHRYRWQPWNYLVEPAVNASPGVQRFYEETALSRFFPAANIEVTLVK